LFLHGAKSIPQSRDRAGASASVCQARAPREISAMSFANTLDNLALDKSPLVRRFEQLIAPKSDSAFEAMAQTSRALTLHNFGRTMRLFAPLYLSNECINNCRYCGFSRDNPILRVTLSVDEVMAEARHLTRQGFRQILLVAGEHPKFVSRDYLVECCALSRRIFRQLRSRSVRWKRTITFRLSALARKGWSLSGNVQPRGLCGNAYRWSQARF